jgi:hypothetical protein
MNAGSRVPVHEANAARPRVAIAADRAEALVQDRSQARGAGSAMDEDPVFA